MPEQPRPFGWSPWLAAAVVLLMMSTVYFVGREREYAKELARVRERLRQQTIELTRMNEAFVIINGLETKEAAFKAGQLKGKVYLHPTNGVLLIASNLPQAPAGKVYEMWMFPKGGKPVPAGLFQPESGGSAIHLQLGAVDLGTTSAVAVTLENEGGAAQPTTTPVIVAAVAAN